MYMIRTKKGSYKGERLKVRGFKYAEDMHKFLNTADNANHWRQCDPVSDPMRPGTYAWAGGTWHNVKHLDPCALAHI